MHTIVWVALLFIWSLLCIITLMLFYLCFKLRFDHHDTPHGPYYKWFKLTELWFAAKIRQGQIVVLIDFRDKILYSVAVPEPGTDSLESWFDPVVKVGLLRLLHDGSVVDEQGKETWIKNWLPLDTESRVFMVLQGARNFEF